MDKLLHHEGTTPGIQIGLNIHQVWALQKHRTEKPSLPDAPGSTTKALQGPTRPLSSHGGHISSDA